MIPNSNSNSNSIDYVCVADGTKILAEFNSDDVDLGTVAIRCLEKTPRFHSTFFHTVHHKTYAFLIGDPFTCFAIFDGDLATSDGFSFLRSVKDALDEIGDIDLDALNPLCFQEQFDPIFHQLFGSRKSLRAASMTALHSRSTSTEPLRGKAVQPMPLLSEAAKSLKLKTKSRFFGLKENSNKSDDRDEGFRLGREFSIAMNKTGLFGADLGHRKARQVWNKHVWVVLWVDLIICSIMFVVWLWICRGFKCIDG